MRIGLASYRSENRNTAFNVSQIERALKEAQGKVDLLCFGEAFLRKCAYDEAEKNRSRRYITICPGKQAGRFGAFFARMESFHSRHQLRSVFLQPPVAPVVFRIDPVNLPVKAL